jgi:hypothetical protein
MSQTPGTPTSEELLKAFPEWTKREETLWLEIYQETIPLLIGARLDPESERRGPEEYEDRLAAFKEDVLMAAQLADAAVEEMQTRFTVQDQQKKQGRKKAKQAYQTRRAGRLESRK